MKLQKVTNSEEKPRVGRHGRWYDDACGTAFALELVGERWSLLIVRELMFGGRRFTNLKHSLGGISARVLAERLEGLEAAGIVTRQELPPPLAVKLYALTPWGQFAERAIMELGRWAASCPRHDPTLPLSPASLMLSFKTLFLPARAARLTLAATMRIDKDVFDVRIVDGALEIARGEAQAPDFTLAAPVAAVIAALVHGKLPLAKVEAMGLAAGGDATAMARFVDCFELPEKFS